MKKTLLLAITAVLLHGVSRAQTNWMDWRNGRPGVQVVTNAPSRAEHIALSNNVSALSSRVTATNAMFSAWFAGLQSRTSYWDTAYSWGDWHSAVAQKLDSSATNGWETGSHAAFLTAESDPVALAAIAALKVKMRWDTSDANVYDTLEGGTNWVVYRIATVPSETNYSITYSADFRKEEDGVILYPPFTNSIPYPIYNGYGDWMLSEESGIRTLRASLSTVWTANDLSWPSVLLPSSDFSFGTATVSIASYTYGTNEIYRVDITALTNTTAVLQSLRASLTSVSNTAEQAASDVLLVQGDINNHTANGGIHVTSGDKELINAVPGLTQDVAAVSGAFAGFTNSIPSAGCSVLSMTDETNLVVTGATYAYTAQVTTNYWLSIAQTAPAYHYSITVYGTNACTLADNMRLIGTKTETGTNCVAFKPWTNGLWEVMWGGK